MKCRTVSVLAACVSLLALAGGAFAGVIIDEPFDANTVINSPLASARIHMDMMDMWMGGTSMAMGGMWQLVEVVGPAPMYHAEGFVNMAMEMNDGVAASWNSMVYFVAKPTTNSWGAPGFKVSFDYHTDDFSSGLVATWGVHGWQGGETVQLGSTKYPGSEGTALLGGELWDLSNGAGKLSNANGWHSVEASFFGGDLDRFNFIGMAFTIGDTTADDKAVFMRFDNVRLEAIPEPTSMLLWVATMAATACIRRRLRKHRRATGPPD